MLRLAALLAYSASFAAPVTAQIPDEFGQLDAEYIWVDFWASWCTPCRRSFPWMNSMQSEFADSGLKIIAVNVDKERVLAEEFLAETPAEFQIYYDPDGKLAEEFDVQAMPSSFLMDANGNIISRHHGFRLANTQEYEQEIRNALESQQPNH